MVIKCIFLQLLVFCFSAAIRAEKDVDLIVFEAMMAKPQEESNVRITLGDKPFTQRFLEEDLYAREGKCFSTRDDRKPNRYCMFENTPRGGAFLSLSCPTSRNDLRACGCEIGIGASKDAPNTPTCNLCGFCKDGSLAYDCRNVAEGSCIGRNCLGDCLSSEEEPQDLLLDSTGTRLKVSLFASLSLIASMLFQ